jgi:hypothetical protein
MADFNGWPTRVLENKFVRLEYLAASARIVRFNPVGRPNMFADLGNEGQQTKFGLFHFHGGHRLWHSPEAMPRTYMPDNEGAQVTDLLDGVRIEMPAEVWTNIAKSIEIHLDGTKAGLTIRHELRNDGPWAVELAPWALTMLRLGGVGIFPQPVGNVDPAGLLANRQLSIWPYTRMDDPRLVLRDDAILIRATPSLPPVKIGYFNPHGWEAYWLDGVLFVKRFDPMPGATFPDGGCNTETYCNHKFIELETLGPLVKLAPGAAAVHTETWELYDSLNVPFISDELRAVIK